MHNSTRRKRLISLLGVDIQFVQPKRTKTEAHHSRVQKYYENMKLAVIIKCIFLVDANITLFVTLEECFVSLKM